MTAPAPRTSTPATPGRASSTSCSATQGVVLRVNAAEAGTHRVTVRYANANPGTGLASRRFTLTVNGTTHIPVLFPVTASWATWSTVTVLAPLTAGATSSTSTRARTTTGRSTSTTSRRARHRDHRAGRDAAHLQRQPRCRSSASSSPARRRTSTCCGRRSTGPPPPTGSLHGQLPRAGRRRPRDRAGGRRHLPAGSATTAPSCSSTASRSSTTTASTAHDQGRRRHADGRLARARDPLLPGGRRRSGCSCSGAARARRRSRLVPNSVFSVEGGGARVVAPAPRSARASADLPATARR